jgi:hypothetical protein
MTGHYHGYLTVLCRCFCSIAAKLIHFLLNNDAMNVAEYSALENWERLFSEIQKGCFLSVELTDSEADRYGFANEILMPRMRERVVETLRSRHIDYLKFGNKFFMTMSEQQQQSFFLSIFTLPATRIFIGEETDSSTESPAITISTSALLETLPHLHTWVRLLNGSNFALTRQSDVQALLNIIASKRATLHYLNLERIECNVDDCHKEDSDEPNRFLDPVIHAASSVNEFGYQLNHVQSTQPWSAPERCVPYLLKGDSCR